MSGISIRCATVSTWLFVVLVSDRRRRFSIIRLFLDWRCMRCLVPPKLGPEPLVLFSKHLAFFIKRNQTIKDPSLVGVEGVIDRRGRMVPGPEIIPQKRVYSPDDRCTIPVKPDLRETDRIDMGEARTKQVFLRHDGECIILEMGPYPIQTAPPSNRFCRSSFASINNFGISCSNQLPCIR